MNTTTTTPATMTTAVDADLQDARDDLRIRLNRVINAFAGRTDVLLDTLWDAPDVTTPAWFEPARAVVTIQCDIAIAGAHPDDVDPASPAGREEHPIIAGLCAHEGGHAHSTRWTEAVTDTTPAAIIRAASLLEEPRVEARQIARRPGDQHYLRAASQHLHLTRRPTDPSALEDRWQAAQAALLLIGRVDAGVLTDDDVSDVIPVITDALGVDLLATLRGLWREAIALGDDDGAKLLDVAARWIDALGIPRDTDPDAPGTRLRSNGCSAPRGAGDDAGDGDGEHDAITAAAGKAIARITDETKSGGSGAGDTDGDDGAARQEARAEEKRLQAKAERAAVRVFKPTPEGDAESGHGPGRGRYNPITGTRPPTKDEQAAANRLAEALRRARFRERTVRTVASAVPPGRIVGRDAMLATAQRTLGHPITATPFRQRHYRHAEQPELTVGIAVDVSGSMSWAAPILSSVAWTVAQAVGRVGGRSATVAFGNGVTPIVPPGRPPARVTTFAAKDGTERFARAANALDGALRLASGRGVRLLIVVSDGQFYASGEPEEAERLIRRLREVGVAVLHVSLSSARTKPLPGATLVNLDSSTDTLDTIATAATKALADAR